VQFIAPRAVVMLAECYRVALWAALVFHSAAFSGLSHT
jgi:hypothetical protein